MTDLVNIDILKRAARLVRHLALIGAVGRLVALERNNFLDKALRAAIAPHFGVPKAKHDVAGKGGGVGVVAEGFGGGEKCDNR